MIRVTVELVSAIHPSRSKVLGVAVIGNVGTGSDTRGDYEATLFHEIPDIMDFHAELSQVGGKKTWRTGTVRGFPRKQRGGWDLLYRALVACGVGQRNP